MQNKHRTIILPVLAALLMALVCGFALAEAPECPSPDSPNGAHNWNVETKPATCLTGETVIETCSYCGATNRFTISAPNPDAHDFSYTEIPPTCVEPGRLREKCSICGFAQYVPGYEDSHPALGHDFSVDVAAVEATCTEGGKTAGKKCSRCDATEGITDTPALGHDFSVDVAEVSATCTKGGKSAGKKCSRCDATDGITDTAALGHSWDAGVVTTPATTENPGVKTYTCTRANCDGYNAAWGAANGNATGQNSAGKATYTESIPQLEPQPTQKPSNNGNGSGSGNSNSGSSNAAPAVTEAPAGAYGSIVSDIERADEPYVAETVADAMGANTVLVITADPDEDGTYTLRNLHLTDALLSQLNSEGILTIRFVVGDATVEFPVASYTGDAVTTIKGDLDADVTAFLVTIDPNATTADGQPGVSVGSSVATADGAEYDVTPLIPDLTLTIADAAAQPVSEAAVYTAEPAEPAVEEAVAA